MQPSVSCHVASPICAFQLLSTEPGRYQAPAELSWQTAREVSVPTTIAGALQREGLLDLSAPPDFEAQDFWFRTLLPEALGAGAAAAAYLVFEGLAGIVDVWLDGEHLLHAENMFRRYEVAADALRGGSELVLRFASLRAHLAQKRPRPRFRTRLVDQQQLRWVRTSLLGRTPGFAPCVPALGPYRGISLELRRDLSVVESRLQARVREGRAAIELSLSLRLEEAQREPPAATLVIDGPAARGRFPLEASADGTSICYRGRFALPEAALWWPHTHGPQPRSHVHVELSATNAARLPVRIDFGQVGFRELAVDAGPDGQGFRLVLNGVPLFCRGACWSVDDIVSLSAAGVPQTLARAREAGMNMVRVGGTTLYESDTFYETCDALGILVFQDFMFANMDYPDRDEGFVREVRTEVEQQLMRFAGRPCIAVLCGGSEVEQQAAMLGLAPALGQSSLFYGLLPELARAHLPDVPYVPNSPCGGALPFQVDAGIAHYYGVGAYLRPLHDARISGVRFAAECLAFANVPNASAVEALLGELEQPFHHPRWKERVPRDRGAGWDFEDVRDHYLELLYGCSARQLRYTDPGRYLTLSRTVVVDVIEATVAELRRSGSGCGGALVWWLKDLWLGAGWGVLDSRSVPKSAYYALRRAFAGCALFFTDEGMNGPALQLVHDGPEPFDAQLSLVLYRAGDVVVARAERTLRVTARSMQQLRVDAMFESFLDAGYVYRFGPPGHDLIAAVLKCPAGSVLSRAFALPVSTTITELEAGLSASFEARDGCPGVAISTEKFARRVELELDDADLVPEDNYFHLEPKGQHWVRLVRTSDLDSPPEPRAATAVLRSCAEPRASTLRSRAEPRASTGPLRGRVRALNAPRAVGFSSKAGDP